MSTGFSIPNGTSQPVHLLRLLPSDYYALAHISSIYCLHLVFLGAFHSLWLEAHIDVKLTVEPVYFLSEDGAANGGRMLRRKGSGGLRSTLVDYWMPRRKEERPVAWPRRDEEEAGSGMACTTAFSSQFLCFHGCSCWLALRLIMWCWIQQGQGILMEVGEVHNSPRVVRTC
jgi:hypothetical protein